MITSYLFILRSSETVFHDELAHLFHLVSLRILAFGLDIDDLFHASLREDVVIPFCSFIEAERFQQAAQIPKREVLIRRSLKNLDKQFRLLSHITLGLVATHGFFSQCAVAPLRRSDTASRTPDAAEWGRRPCG